MRLTDAGLVGFAPDTGQIAKGGSDIVEVLTTYQDRINHVHLKDWNGVADRDANGERVDCIGLRQLRADRQRHAADAGNPRASSTKRRRSSG